MDKSPLSNQPSPTKEKSPSKPDSKYNPLSFTKDYYNERYKRKSLSRSLSDEQLLKPSGQRILDNAERILVRLYDSRQDDDAKRTPASPELPQAEVLVTVGDNKPYEFTQVSKNIRQVQEVEVQQQEKPKVKFDYLHSGVSNKVEQDKKISVISNLDKQSKTEFV